MAETESQALHEPGTCWECDQYRSLLAALRHFENRKKSDRKTRTEFSPFGALKGKT